VTPVIVRRERILSLPVDVLWQLLEPADTLPAWLPFVARSRQVSGKGLGRRQKVTLHWGGARVEVDQEVTVYQANQAIAWKHLPGQPSAEGRRDDVTISVAMESMGPGTRLVLEARLVPASLGAWMRLKLITARRVRAAFDRGLTILAGVGG
jgi:uncharacterized membrane protein